MGRDTKPDFNLTVAEETGNGLPFRVTGSSELERNPLGSLQMNMSTCSRIEGWWGVSPISLDSDLDDVSGVTNPTVQLTFDDSSTNFIIRSWVVANTLGEGDEETPRISARLTIEFLGRIDAARSDVLNEGTPVMWIPSMGFGNNSLSLDYESGALAAAGRFPFHGNRFGCYFFPSNAYMHPLQWVCFNDFPPNSSVRSFEMQTLWAWMA
ncbi:unnamed protein product [Penicillium crustosum]